MARKMVLIVEMEVTVIVDNDVKMDELELGMYSDSDSVNVEDCEAKKVGILKVIKNGD